MTLSTLPLLSVLAMFTTAITALPGGYTPDARSRDYYTSSQRVLRIVLPTPTPSHIDASLNIAPSQILTKRDDIEETPTHTVDFNALASNVDPGDLWPSETPLSMKEQERLSMKEQERLSMKEQERLRLNDQHFGELQYLSLVFAAEEKALHTKFLGLEKALLKSFLKNEGVETPDQLSPWADAKIAAKVKQLRYAFFMEEKILEATKQIRVIEVLDRHLQEFQMLEDKYEVDDEDHKPPKDDRNLP